MTNPVAVKYMSRAEIESLMYTTTAESGNQQAELFEATSVEQACWSRAATNEASIDR